MPAECLQNVREVPIENEALKKHRNDAEHRDDDNKQLVEENVCRTAVMVTGDDEVIDKQGGEEHHRRDAHINIPTSPKVVVAGESLGIKDDIGDDVVALVVEIPHQDRAEKPLLHVLVVRAVCDEQTGDTQKENNDEIYKINEETLSSNVPVSIISFVHFLSLFLGNFISILSKS